MMMTARQILAKFGTAARCAELVNALPHLRPDGCKPLTFLLVNNWRHRDRIPSPWYPALLEAARSEGLDITAHDLAFHIAASQRTEPTEAAA